jgi:hypothetical protein
MSEMGTELAQVMPQAGAMVQQGFGSTQLSVTGETAGSAIAAQQQAAVQARYIMAVKRPRDMMQVRQRVLMECSRKGFAEAARYEKPLGGSRVSGFSIRFAEAAARCMTNVLCETRVTWDDNERRIINVSVTDLESNVCYPVDVILDKTVERANATGRTVLYERLNTSGKKVYVVVATEDELLVKQNSAVSKAMRNAILRLVPGDILDEAEEHLANTLHREDGKDPQAALKGIADGFLRLGISVAQLSDYLGHPVDSSTPDELATLKAIGTAIKEKETTWSAVMEEAKALRSDSTEIATAKSRTEALKEKVKPKTTAPAPVTNSNAKILLEMAEGAQSGADVTKVNELLKTYRGSMPAEELAQVEKAIAAAESRLGM